MSLDGTIADYWPDYPNQEIGRKVKIRHLLSHTGGTGDIFGPEFDAHRTELKTLADYAKLYGTRGPTFEPGSRFEYSNYGFLLLGLLVEKVSGKSYYDYVRENIFVPAGMRSTDSLPESEAILRRATGYMKEKLTGNRTLTRCPGGARQRRRILDCTRPSPLRRSIAVGKTYFT